MPTIPSGSLLSRHCQRRDHTDLLEELPSNMVSPCECATANVYSVTNCASAGVPVPQRRRASTFSSPRDKEVNIPTITNTHYMHNYAHNRGKYLRLKC